MLSDCIIKQTPASHELAGGPGNLQALLLRAGSLCLKAACLWLPRPGAVGSEQGGLVPPALVAPMLRNVVKLARKKLEAPPPSPAGLASSGALRSRRRCARKRRLSSVGCAAGRVRAWQRAACEQCSQLYQAHTLLLQGRYSMRGAPWVRTWCFHRSTTGKPCCRHLSDMALSSAPTTYATPSRRTDSTLQRRSGSRKRACVVRDTV